MDYQELSEKYPFLTVGVFLNEEIVGIVQNQDALFVSIYVYEKLNDSDEKKLFLKLGETWWTETNRLIPINIVLKSEFKQFRYCLKTFAKKEFKHICGPIISVQDLSQRRVKRRSIALR